MHRRVVGLIVVAGFLMAATPSYASIISGGNGELDFYARQSEANDVTVWQRSNGDLGVKDLGSIVTPKSVSGLPAVCKSLTVYKVDCGPVSNWSAVHIALYDGNDTAKVALGVPASVSVLITGNAGNDTLIGGNGDDYLKAGPGDDYLDGRGGANTADVGLGVDTVVIHPQDWIAGLLDDETDTCVLDGVVGPINGCDFYASPG